MGLRYVTPVKVPDISGTTALRNLLYGIECWHFAGFAVFLWWLWSRDEVLAARAEQSRVTPLSADTGGDRTVPEARIPS